MFTIEVKEKPEDKEFSFKDLEMFHQECYGGKIKQTYGEEEWKLTCRRCGQWCQIQGDRETGASRIVKTAMDGEERKVEAWGEWYHWLKDKVRVIQKKGD